MSPIASIPVQVRYLTSGHSPADSRRSPASLPTYAPRSRHRRPRSNRTRRVLSEYCRHRSRRRRRPVRRPRVRLFRILADPCSAFGSTDDPCPASPAPSLSGRHSPTRRSTRFGSAWLPSTKPPNTSPPSAPHWLPPSANTERALQQLRARRDALEDSLEQLTLEERNAISRHAAVEAALDSATKSAVHAAAVAEDAEDLVRRRAELLRQIGSVVTKLGVESVPCPQPDAGVDLQ
eukprot:gnl/Ergobibamus_cyprinoides/5435.p1 GENE.gnl/Ergobibamus_cyprinoides/5435~~gnl/Ergobibamus_cyprinoides/5435.p1  ORF type:complete len:235 (+),score=22.64 gnl/Ergobibamus_cyprinoides/5435:123-827(+)